MLAFLFASHSDTVWWLVSCFRKMLNNGCIRVCANTKPAGPPARPLSRHCLSLLILHFKKHHVIHCLVVLLWFVEFPARQPLFQRTWLLANFFEFWMMFKTSTNENRMNVINKHNIQMDIRYVEHIFTLICLNFYFYCLTQYEIL